MTDRQKEGFKIETGEMEELRSKKERTAIEETEIRV
jgi:hypothetical protein